MNFKIKICGITNSQDAMAAAQVGADAIGLNFYSKSLRSVTYSVARKIVSDLGKTVGTPVRTIGVFVDTPIDEMMQIAEDCSLDGIQLHGNQEHSIVSRIRDHSQLHPKLANINIIRALRCGHSANEVIECEIHSWKLAGVDSVLLDSAPAGPADVNTSADKSEASDTQFGGTGECLEWDNVAELIARMTKSIPIILAGGLTEKNVSTAILSTKPSAVDVASGIEDLPGKKDNYLMKQFVLNARRAFEQI